MFRILKSIRLPLILLPRQRFCNSKHPLNQLPEPQQELDPMQVQFINKLLRGEYTSQISTPESENEQRLSFDLINLNNPSLILNKLKNHEDVTQNQLFLYIYAYSNLKTLKSQEIESYLKKVIEGSKELGKNYMLKFYQMIYQIKDTITLPQFPNVQDVPNEDLVELGYFLAKFYPRSPELEQFIDIIPRTQIVEKPLVYIEMLDQLTYLEIPQDKQVSDWFDLINKPENAAGTILYYLKKGDISLVPKIQKLNVRQLQIQIIIELLLECIIHNQRSQKLQKHLSTINLAVKDFSPLTYLNIWILMTKYRNLIAFKQTVQALSNLDVPKDLSVYDIFTVLMSGVVLEQKEFLLKNESLIDQFSLNELNGNQVYALWKGASKYKLNNMLLEIRKNVFNRNDILDNKKKEILGN